MADQKEVTKEAIEDVVEEVKEEKQQGEIKEEKPTETKKKATTTSKKKVDSNESNEELKQLQLKIEALESQLNEKDNSLSELQAKVSEFENKSAEQIAAIRKKDVELKLAERNLSAFKSFFENVEPDQLDEQIDQFQNLLKEKQVDNSYKPNAYKQDDQYSQSQKSGDVFGMLNSKFSKLFN